MPQATAHPVKFFGKDSAAYLTSGVSWLSSGKRWTENPIDPVQPIK